ncbi:hypothetical protein V2J09_003862 [Rumex salicifolius]
MIQSSLMAEVTIMVVALSIWASKFLRIEDTSKEKIWLWIFLKLLLQLKFVKIVLLANNIVLNFPKENPGEQLRIWKKRGFISFRKSQKLFSFQKLQGNGGNESERFIKTLRTDRGVYCDEKGIQRELTIAYTL